MSTILTIIPVPSEKAFNLAKSNVYTFRVPLTANKQQVAAAVEAQYGVSVTGVKSLVQNGKAIAYSKGKRARPGITKRRDFKKAYVTVAAGDSIKLFNDTDEQAGDK